MGRRLARDVSGESVGSVGMVEQDTIFAMATPPGRSGVAVVRVSGPAAGQVVIDLTGDPLPPPRLARLRPVRNPIDGETIDQGLVLWFPGPASFTGDDVAEFQIHGGPAVIEAMITLLGQQAGCRLAEAGEFTRRAFDNGRLNLTEVEGLADLIDAQTAAQRRQAHRQFSGEFGALIAQWRDRLVRALAHMEADLDFPEEDLPDGLAPEVSADVSALGTEIAGHLADEHRGERLRDGFHVAIIGAPNAGKSSLLNRLARKPAAIVSDIAGTTRDLIHVPLDIDGVPVTVTDTAGLRENGDVIEEEGIRRAKEEADQADLVVLVIDGSAPIELKEEWSAPLLRVVNKIDLQPEPPIEADAFVSAGTGAGVNDLLTKISQAIGADLAAEGAMITRARHREALEDVVVALGRAAGAATAELAAEDLRLGVRSLGRLTGRVDVEDLLDVIFRDFCIGK
ncbi:MAG: tRNA uridine-5-carboxymethylaminomethyl(34) synthesis GTPase MnmE [Pseudomonadota bacterium]